MEAVGLAVGAIGLPITLIHLTERNIEYVQQIKNAPEEVTELAHELQAVRDVLLLVRDLVERQATDDADATTLSILLREGRELGDALEDLRSLLKKINASRSSFTIKFLFNATKLDAFLGKIKARRQVLQLLVLQQSVLQQSGVPTRTQPSDSTSTDIHPSTNEGWLVDLLSPDETLKALQRNYHPGSGAWLFTDPSFKQWEETIGRTLWCSGMPGAGKSFLCSRVVEYLNDKYPSAKVPVIYAFLSYKDAAKQTQSAILRSILAQLVRQSNRVPVYFESPDARGTLPPLDGLWSIVCGFIASFERVFIVLDALDEYASGPSGFLNDFQKIFDMPMASLFVTSRSTFVNQAALGNFAELEIRARDVEIRDYVLQRLSHSRMNKVLRQADLRDEVVNTVVQRSDGMFLHAHLLLEKVLSQPTLKSVRRALSADQSLHSLYDSAMEKITTSSGDWSRCAMEALAWLAFALGPLTVRQLLEAIGIQLTSDDLDADEVPFIEGVSQACAGLIVLNQSRQQVSLLHYSLNEYLQTFLPRVKYLLPGSNEPQTFITKKCLACLRFRPFALVVVSELADLGDRLDKYAMLGYAARYWGEHARHVPLEEILDDVMSLFELNNNITSAGLVMSIFEQHPGHYEQAYRGMIGLHISAYFGLSDIVEHLVAIQKINPDIATIGGWTALHWAARRGRASTVACLLRHGASTESVTKLDGWNPLHLAAKEGNHDVVKLLLESKADPNARDKQLRTALYLATWAGYAEIVQYLLENGANPALPNTYGATALHCAAKRGRTSIVRHLLASGTDVNAEDTVGLTALDEALRKQNDPIIEALVGSGATTKRSGDIRFDAYIVDDLDWETYVVNDEDTTRIENGSQCVCHVLEKSVHASQSSLKVFRKTYTLSKDADGNMRKYFQSERRILERLRHPNVVAYLDFDEDPDQNAFLLYTEYCDLGDLNTRYCRPPDTGNDDDEDSDYGFYSQDPQAENVNKESLRGPEFWVLVAQVASALSYLHYGLTTKKADDNWSACFERSWIKVIHRDIKPANVVMQSCDISKCVYKLCDLGIASEAGKGAGFNTTRLIGTQGFRPPEILRNRPWTTKGDIWAFGETIREMNKLKDATFEDDIRNLIDNCTAKSPKSRPNSLDLMEKAYDMLKENEILATLPTPSTLQTEAIYSLLGGEEGGYILKALYLVAELLDDIEPFEGEKPKTHRKATIQRLGDLWRDGAEAPFLKYPNEFSLHILILLDLSEVDRTKHFEKLVLKQPDVNKQWKQSRWTSLHLATQTGNLDLVKRLLALGANRSRLDLHGHAPAFYVDSAANPEIYSLLKLPTKEDKTPGDGKQRTSASTWGENVWLETRMAGLRM